MLLHFSVIFALFINRADLRNYDTCGLNSCSKYASASIEAGKPMGALRSNKNRFFSLREKVMGEKDTDERASPDPDDSMSLIIVACATSAFGAAVIVLICSIARYGFCCCKDDSVPSNTSAAPVPPQTNTVSTSRDIAITYESIVRATNYFDRRNCIGSGGFGSTYRARLSLTNSSDTDTFLIYNYIPGGNLDRAGTSGSEPPEPSTGRRSTGSRSRWGPPCRSCTRGRDPCVLHRDVKPSNVLLDPSFHSFGDGFDIVLVGVHDGGSGPGRGLLPRQLVGRCDYVHAGVVRGSARPTMSQVVRRLRQIEPRTDQR